MAKAFEQATELDDGGLAGRGSTGCLHASDLDHEAAMEVRLGVGEVYAGRGQPPGGDVPAGDGAQRAAGRDAAC